MCGREIGKNGLGLVKNNGASNAQMDESTLKTAVEVQETVVSNPGSLDRSASPNDSLTDSSSGSVTHFFDQHVLSTLEKAKRKLCQRNLLVCGRPKGFYSGRAQAQHTDSPPSPAEETSPLTVNAVSDSKLQKCGIFCVDAYECLQLDLARYRMHLYFNVRPEEFVYF